MLTSMEGIVLKTQNYGETHKIITILTKQQGKISAICRGANKTKSRLNAVAQPFIKATFLIYVTKGLSTVQQGEIENSFRYIREDIIKTAYAAYIMELTDKIIEAKHPDKLVYSQLDQTLEWINAKTDYMIPVMMYELKLFQKGGFAPIVDRCVNCGRQEIPYTFSVREGGLLCPHCTVMDSYAKNLPPSFPKLLTIFKEVALDRVGNISVKKENQQLLRLLLDEYYDQYGGFNLKSKRFLAQIDRLS